MQFEIMGLPYPNDLEKHIALIWTDIKGVNVLYLTNSEGMELAALLMKATK